MTFGPPVPSSGPLSAKIALIGEAPGDEESIRLRPFVGPSGQELRRMLRTVGVNMEDCYVTNVFSCQPSGNNLSLYGDGDRSGLGGTLGPLTSNPTTFVSDEHYHHITRLHAELTTLSPNIAIALGNTALWALGLGQGIKALRGSLSAIQLPNLARPLKVLPTYHPAAVLRDYSLRIIAISDLQKAVNESHSPTLTFDSTTLWLAPGLDDLREFDAVHMAPARECAVDIETKRGQISCVSFAPSVDHSLVIPFWIEGHSPNYWHSIEEEALAWAFIRKWMEREDLVKVFQNGLFDVQYLGRMCTPRNCTADTMLAHHSLFSELPKDLGFLGSVYASFQAWKRLRHAPQADRLKRDE